MQQTERPPTTRRSTAVAAMGIVLGVVMLAWPVRLEINSNLGGTAVVDCGSALTAAFHQPSHDVDVAPGIDESGAWFHCGPHATKWVFGGVVVLVTSGLAVLVARTRRRQLQEAFDDA